MNEKQKMELSADDVLLAWAGLEKIGPKLKRCTLLPEETRLRIMHVRFDLLELHNKLCENEYRGKKQAGDTPQFQEG
jgi:hypothetical protein